MGKSYKFILIIVACPLVAMSQREEAISMEKPLDWFEMDLAKSGGSENVAKHRVAYSKAMADDRLFNRVAEVFMTAANPSATEREKSALRSAALLLAYSGRDDSIPVIVSILENSDPKSATVAIEALQVSGNPKAIDPLLKQLKTYETMLPSSIKGLTPTQRDAIELYVATFGALARFRTESVNAARQSSFERVRQRYANRSGESEMVSILESMRAETASTQPTTAPVPSPTMMPNQR